MDKGQDLAAHITGVADMHVLCSSHVPVLSDLARKIVELRQGKKRTPVKLDENKPWEWTFKSGVDYDDITLQAVADMYSTNASRTTTEMSHVACHTSVEEVRELIEEIRAVPCLPFVLRSEVWQRMVWMDDL